MSGIEKPRQRTIARLTASIRKAYAYATTGTSAGAQPGPEGLNDRPTVTEQELRQMGAIKHFPNENVEETRRAHFEYLEDKKKEFTNLLLRLKTEKHGLEADEAELVHRQWWAARQKETLTRDFENLLREERMAMHAQVKKKPQEVEAEREGGEPNLQAQVEHLDEAKRKVLVSLREVEDEEIGNLDEGEQLKTKREELTRHTQETEQKLAGVEQALLRVSRAMKEQEAAPPVEHDRSTRKRTAPEACEESQPTKAKTLHGLEEEEPEDEEGEEHVCQPVREKKAAVINLQGPVRKSTNIALNTDGSSRAEEVSREKEVNASESRAAEGPAMQQRSTSTLISVDQLEQAIANMEFPRDDENKICVPCPSCKPRKDVCGFPADILRHFAAHLRSEDRPFLCSQDECHYTSVKVEKMRRHFEGRHKELSWTDEIAKACEVGPNRERLNAIKQVLAERTRLCAEKLSFEELEERANTSTFERDPEGRFVFNCSVCELTMNAPCGRPQFLSHHLKSHLTPECLPFACPARGCEHVTARLELLKEHFRSVHKKLEWTAQKEKESTLTENANRLEAIVHGVLAANHDESGLSLDDLEAQAGNCTFSRDADGVLRMKCSMCTKQISITPSNRIRQHFASHLRQSSRPLRCPEDGCPYGTGRVDLLQRHVLSLHGGKELTTTAIETDCEVLVNKTRLDEIVAKTFSRRSSKAS